MDACAVVAAGPCNEEVSMSIHSSRVSPSPSTVGYRVNRRGLLKGAGAAAVGLSLPSWMASAQVELGTASGELTVGSNYSNELPKKALHAAVDAFPNKNVTIKLNEVDHNTFQENITTYLQNPDDVIP